MWFRVISFVLLVTGCAVSAEPDREVAKAYDKSLRMYVEEATGFVDYFSWGKDRAALDAYVKWGIQSLTIKIYSEWSRSEKISFWINLYNALTIQAILDHYPVGSIREIEGVWDKKSIGVMGNPLSLNEIEHAILRKEFKELRVHYALVCAAKSCPPLRSELYTGDQLEDQLRDQQERFFSKKKNFHFDANAGVLTLSALLDWYENDFIGGLINASVSEWSDEMKKKSLILYLRKNALKGRELDDTLPEIRYADYDWTLNKTETDSH